MTFNLTDVRQLISQVCLSPLPADIDNSADLMENGFLDSISIVQLITKIEEKFDISFKFEHLTKNNFQNISAIAETLAKNYGIQFK